MLPGINTGGGGLSNQSSAASRGSSELNASHIFNFNKSDNLPLYMIGGLVGFYLLTRLRK